MIITVPVHIKQMHHTKTIYKIIEKPVTVGGDGRHSGGRSRTVKSDGGDANAGHETRGDRSPGGAGTNRPGRGFETTAAPYVFESGGERPGGDRGDTRVPDLRSGPVVGSNQRGRQEPHRGFENAAKTHQVRLGPRPARGPAHHGHLTDVWRTRGHDHSAGDRGHSNGNRDHSNGDRWYDRGLFRHRNTFADHKHHNRFPSLSDRFPSFGGRHQFADFIIREPGGRKPFADVAFPADQPDWYRAPQVAAPDFDDLMSTVPPRLKAFLLSSPGQKDSLNGMTSVSSVSSPKVTKHVYYTLDPVVPYGEVAQRPTPVVYV